MVNASSVAVYKRINDRATREDDPKEPNSVYGLMKVAVESLAGLYNRNYGMKIKSLRYGQGVGFSAGLSPKRFWGVLLNHSLEGKPIPVWGEGKAGRDLIYVRDMAAAAVFALRCPDECGSYNIGSGYVCTNLQIAQAYCQVFSNPGGIEMIPAAQDDGSWTCMDCQKAEERLGFVPKYDLISMVEDIKREWERWSQKE